MCPDELSAWASAGSAGVALLALIVAIVAAFVTWRTNVAQQKTLELQRAQFASAEERAEREQASKVTFLLSGKGMSEQETNDDGTVSVRVQGHDAATLLNASDSPVFLVIMYEKYRTKSGNRTRVLAERDNLMPTGGNPVECPFKPGSTDDLRCGAARLTDQMPPEQERCVVRPTTSGPPRRHLTGASIS